jgi:hypothetical protein
MLAQRNYTIFQAFFQLPYVCPQCVTSPTPSPAGSGLSYDGRQPLGQVPQQGRVLYARKADSLIALHEQAPTGDTLG